MQQTWHSRAASLLDDPIMVDWALHHYAHLAPGSELGQRLGELWFHDINIRRWIDGDDAEARRLALLYVPEEYFVNATSTIAARWSQWPSNLASSAVRILAAVEPALAAQVFADYLEHEPALSVPRVAAILGNVEALPYPMALPMIEKLMALSRGNEGPPISHIRLHVLAAALRLKQIHVLPDLLEALFSQPDPQIEAMVEAVTKDLFGHDSFADLYFVRRSGYSVATFTELACLFESDAPLAEMDAVVMSPAPLAAALSLLEPHRDRCAESRRVWELLQQSKACRSNDHPVELAALVLSAVASAFERKSVDTAALTMEEMLTLLAQDVRTSIHYDALVNALRGLPTDEVIAATIIHQHRVKDTFGGVMLARVMGDLCWAQFVQPLIGCLEEAQSDFLKEAATKSLLAIGEPARDALIAQWDTLDRSQRIYGGSVITAVGGAAVAQFALSRKGELLHDDVEEWCAFMLASPDPRMIEQLRPELRRNQDLINETYYRLCRLLDQEGPELADLRTGILHRRAQLIRRLESLDHDELFEPRTTLSLSLRCTSCKDVNRYEVRHLVIGDTAQHPYLIAEEFACLSCGEFADFEFEAEAKLALLAETMRLRMAADSGEKQDSALISRMDVLSSDGTLQPAPTAYAQLREIVGNNPDDWLSWFRMGNVNLGINRPKGALGCFRKAYAINPRSPETIINLASILSETGQGDEAFGILNNALKIRTQWQTLSSSPDEIGSDFAQLFNNLRRLSGRGDIPALHPGFLGQSSKIGRNDPCPCGSGRKFKKCCMK